MKIILNADDLGASEAVNDAIFALIAERRITSATLLANGPSVEHATRRLREFPRCSFGAHLNLTQFKPVGDDPELAPLLGEDGCFAGNRVREVALGPKLCRAIFREWTAQLERLGRLGVSLSHFDSHHHVHTVPALFPVVKWLQHSSGIRRVRISMNLYDGTVSRRLVLAKAVWNRALRYCPPTATTEIFTAFQVFAHTPKERLRGCDSIELMVHPGNSRFEQETRLLSSEWLDRLPFAARCVSYSEL